MRRLFDGAVDLFILEVFVHVAPVARDSSFWCPAVDVPAKWIGRISKDVHERMSDTFSWGLERAMVQTYVVPFARKELVIFSILGIVTTFGLKAEEAHASIVVQGGYLGLIRVCIGNGGSTRRSVSSYWDRREV